MSDAVQSVSRHLLVAPFAWFLRLVYGVYAWLVFLLCVLLAILFTLLVPGLDRRRSWVTAVCRGLFRVIGMPVEVSGLDGLPTGHCVIVANHASYIDGVVLQAFLPPRFSYVIKGEMRKIPVVHFLLRRIGAKFVERFVTSGSARDARTLLKAATAGESLVFFPEGTFIKQAGLGRFHGGAFAAAIKSSVPIVPVVIHGSRAILPSGHVLPRPGALHIEILQSIVPSDPAFADSAMLVEASRQRILARLDEPDLVIDKAAEM